jgi:E3 ubiquitin-protein ligase HUWE1
MLQSHYNIDLDRVGQLAMPFAKKVTTQAESAVPTTPATPTAKGKEKAGPTHKGSTTTVYANDLVSMVKGGSGIGSQLKGTRNGVDTASLQSESSWEDWGDVKLTYYPKVNGETEPTSTNGTPRASPASAAPITPTPIRRSSNLGPHGHRASRVSISDESTSSRPSTLPSEETQRPSFKTVEISAAKLKSAGIHPVLRENIPGLPRENQYELLTKLRVADALTSSLEKRQQILGIRLLAITNLAYIHPEATFLESTLKQDSDEPRRFQLASQLAELVHPPAEGDVPIPRDLQTFAFSALNGLAQHQTKYSDVCAALNTNVNHGVLLYVIRTAVAEMAKDDAGDKTTPEDEWRNALFNLISDLSVMPRTGGDLVTAGLIPILVEIVGLRTAVAERYQPKVLQFLDNIMYSARDAFQTLVSSDGLDAVQNLIVFEVTTAAENAASGKGMPADQRSATVDYEIPFFQQQTLKWLFKFIHHMMTTAGGYGGNFDRLLRNLIDSSQLLSSLRQIISNANCFGSIVWTNAVSILNDFINNEPTSFAVIAEAGLSRALLEAVTCKTIVMPSPTKKPEPKVEEPEDGEEGGPVGNASPQSPPSADDDDDDDSDDEQDQLPPRPSIDELKKVREGPLARGIMPTSDTISIIPQAFGAICLNNAGMKMFQASGALESFFEVFESPQHVKCMETNKDLPANLGSSFDELVRHHPPLKPAIMNAILNMVTRVSYLCSKKGEEQKSGAKLWTLDASGKVVVADRDLVNGTSQSAQKGKGKAVDSRYVLSIMVLILCSTS